MLESLKFLSLISGWLAAGGFIVVAALAIGWYLPAFRAVAIAVAVAALTSTFFLAKGVHLGIALEKARWDAAEQRAVARGEKARTDAERTVGNGDAGGLRNDQFDRDGP
jgi:hypothetical protein